MLTKIFLLSSLIAGCDGESGSTTPQQQVSVSAPSPQSSTLHADGATIATRFSPPVGFKRVEATPQSFAHFLRNLSLKPHGAPVLLYDGSEKRNQSAHVAVVNIDVGTRDLQQCADAVMRLRAEYLFAQGRLQDIHFNFTNGFRADFMKWAAGYRIGIDEDRVRWMKTGAPDASHSSLRQFLDVVYSYAGTRSLEKELVPVAFADIQPGDVFIHGGSPGHAVIVVDVARDAAGRRAFMLAQSYMPAQEIQVLKNPANGDGGPWYYGADDESGMLLTPEWEFGVGELRRFAGE